MRVLHAIASLNPANGGPVNALLGLVKAQRQLGLDVHVLAGGLEGPGNETIGGALIDTGASVTHLNRNSRLKIADWIQALFTANAALRSADVLHSHGLWSFVPTLANELSRWRHVPYVVRTCGMLDRWSLTQSPSLKRLHLAFASRSMLNSAALLHATTDREKAEVAKLGLETETVVVPNGVDDLAFHSNDVAAVAEIEVLKGSSRLLLFLGRVDPKKGLDVLIPALKLVQTPNVVLMIVGPRNESYFRDIHAQIQQLGIEGRIKFIDPLYGPRRFAAYSSAELFILPSKQENFGLSVAEAMACSIPVIVSPQVALADFVELKHAGLVVRRDPSDLAAAVDQLLQDDTLRSQMGENGRAAALSDFRWSAIALRWNELYEDLISRTTKRSSAANCR